MSRDRHSKKREPDRAPATQSDGALSQPPAANRQTALAVFDGHRALLLSIAYRMLGSSGDAEDMLQETFLRWRQATVAEIRDPRAFLVTVITRLCINQLQSARVKREQYFGQWLPEPLLTGPAARAPAMPGIDGSLSMAFLMLLERLTPMERAVFLLREVFDYEYAEVAGMLGQSEVNCRQILKRAKEHIAEGRPRFDVSLERREELLQQFLEATAQGDMQGLLALLAKDVVLYTDGGGKATAVPNPIHGAERVARFFFGAREKLMPTDVVRRFAEINGQPGVVVYHQGCVFGVLAMDVAEGGIRNIYIVRNPDKLEGLAKLLPAPC
ncbi:MAG TPA: RNA polymerase sigma-70 factor [Candidatus Limnocylindrales bacterium]|nr:RNA polymerase sigma-70 factor [Candidatus Limnocylindrales bacterium]